MMISQSYDIYLEHDHFSKWLLAVSLTIVHIFVFQ